MSGPDPGGRRGASGSRGSGPAGRRGGAPGADPDPGPEGTTLRFLQAVETVTYVGVAVAAGVALALAVGLVWALVAGAAAVAAGALLGAKFVLFVLGFVVLGYGSLKLRPASPRTQVAGGDGRPRRGLFGRIGGGPGDAGPGDEESEDGDDEDPKRQRTQVAENPGPGPAPDSPTVGDGDRETRFQRLVAATPPMRFYELPADDRLPAGLKLLVAGVGLLVVSYLLESVFGVAAV